jgi:hypothetical protein
MNLIGTLLDTHEISANDIDRDSFGKKFNQNYSVINEMSMNDFDSDPLEPNHNHSVIGPPLDTNLIDRDPFGQIKSI